MSEKPLCRWALMEVNRFKLLRQKSYHVDKCKMYDLCYSKNVRFSPAKPLPWNILHISLMEPISYD